MNKGREWVKDSVYNTRIEPTVMFFGLTNSPAMFQKMMNEILWDLVNTGKVVSVRESYLLS